MSLIGDESTTCGASPVKTKRQIAMSAHESNVAPTKVHLRPTWISYGGTAAVVTGTGLVVGLQSAHSSAATLVGALLIIGVADNLTDSLSVHAYQEAEGLGGKAALRSTVANFIARFTLTLTFVGLVIALPAQWLQPVAIVWGAVLLAALTSLIARRRRASVASEVIKHLIVAFVVVSISKLLGIGIGAVLSGTGS